MIVTGTGHRPGSLGGWEFFESTGEAILTGLLERELQLLAKQGQITKVISGMAMGFDYCLAEAALNVGIPLVAYVPFPDHHKIWGAKSQARYGNILIRASEKYIITSKNDINLENKYSVAQALDRRNKALVDSSDILMVLLDPEAVRGGTYNCVKYANKSPHIRIHELWNKWNQALANTQ